MSQTLQNPFPGLRSFDYEESHLFFGREKHIRDLLSKLEQNHFVAIVGTSGSGKSSLVRAGLLPSIHQGKMNDGKRGWLIASMKPGNTPVYNLAKSLIKNGVFGSNDPKKDQEKIDHMDSLFRASSLGLVQGVRNLLPENTNLLILLDQFEETFRFSGEGIEKNDAECEQFVNLIIDAVRQRDVPIYVVLTIRSDFLGDCVRFEGLPEAINDGHYLVPRLNEKENRLVITGPVQYANGKISPRLVQQVTNDLGDNPDQLPVLQHALMRTWDKWVETAETGEPMDIRHYEMTGTMKHALSFHADEAFNELKNEKQKKLIEQVFKSLTVKAGENRGVRRPTSVFNLLKITGASFDELSEVLFPFRKFGRTFILPAEDISLSESTVLDISHESLMRGWERLKKWVDEETESAELYQRLCSAALLHKSGQAGLWRDPELQLALDWRERTEPNEYWAKQYNEDFDLANSFLDASLSERKAEALRKQRRGTLIRSAVIAFLIIVSGLTTWALFQTKAAKENSAIAEQKTQEALNEKQLAEQAKEMALNASKQAMDAKSFAELQANIAGEQKKLAEVQKSKAEEEAIRAMTQEQEALKQKLLAEQKSKEALSQKQKADSSQSEASRLRMISIGQNLAFKSLQQKEDPQLSALLAFQSYKLVSENKGNVNDPQLYSALFSASQKIDPNYKPVVIKNNTGVQSMVVAGDKLIACYDDGELVSYSSGSFQTLGRTKAIGISSAINTGYISSNGTLAALGLDDFSAAIVNLKNPSQKAQILSGHRGLIRAVVFSDDPNLIATGARDSSVIIWKNFAAVKTMKFPARIKALCFNSDASRLYIGSEDGVVSQYSFATDEVKQFSSNPGSRVQALVCSQNGKTIVASYSSGQVQVLNSKGQLTKSLNESGSVDHLAIDEKNELLIIGTSTKIIHLYKLSDLSLKPVEINSHSGLNALTTDNANYIFVACADKTIRSYPVKTSWFEKIFNSKITRKLSVEEWSTFLGPDVPYNNQ